MTIPNNDDHVIILEEFPEAVMENLQRPKYAIRITFTGFEPAFPGEIFVTYFRMPDTVNAHPFTEGTQKPTLLGSKEEAIRAGKSVQERMDLLEEKERLKSAFVGNLFPRTDREYFVRAVVYNPIKHAEEIKHNEALVKKGQEYRDKINKIMFKDDLIIDNVNNNGVGKSFFMQKFYYDKFFPKNNEKKP